MSLTGVCGQNVDRENSNKVKQEEGALAVAKIKAQAANTTADAEAYNVIAAAKARAEAQIIEANAEAEAIRIKSAADSHVSDQYAREMGLRRIEVDKVRAYGPKTIFVPTETAGAQMGQAMAMGMAAGIGSEARK